MSPQAFFDALTSEGVSFFTGVPDSLLKEFCTFVDASLASEQHIIAANEGSAVGLACGNYLATGHTPFVYLQNSGLGNIVNPLLSLADPEVYSIPMIVMVGWRGSPGVKDEPQHIKQGRVTPAMLDAMEIPYRVLDADSGVDVASWAAQQAAERSGPVVILVQKGAFSAAGLSSKDDIVDTIPLKREEAISILVELLGPEHTVVATTGMISRELYEQRKLRGMDQAQDFLTVGSMGHSSQIAYGIANARPDLSIVCLDGDGAALMHLGGFATIGAGPNVKMLHIVLNNGAHDSVGGQPTVAFTASLNAIASACGYRQSVGPLTTKSEIEAAIGQLAGSDGPNYLEIRVQKGSRADLGRPKETPLENKALFVNRLAGLTGRVLS